MIVDVCPSIPVKKLSIDGLYLENQLEESPVASDISVIADDGQASFWTADHGAVLTNNTASPSPAKGVDS